MCWLLVLTTLFLKADLKGLRCKLLNTITDPAWSNRVFHCEPVLHKWKTQPSTNGSVKQIKNLFYFQGPKCCLDIYLLSFWCTVRMIKQSESCKGELSDAGLDGARDFWVFPLTLLGFAWLNPVLTNWLPGQTKPSRCSVPVCTTWAVLGLPSDASGFLPESESLQGLLYILGWQMSPCNCKPVFQWQSPWMSSI